MGEASGECFKLFFERRIDNDNGRLFTDLERFMANQLYCYIANATKMGNPIKWMYDYFSLSLIRKENTTK